MRITSDSEVSVWSPKRRRREQPLPSGAVHGRPRTGFISDCVRSNQSGEGFGVGGGMNVTARLIALLWSPLHLWNPLVLFRSEIDNVLTTHFTDGLIVLQSRKPCAAYICHREEVSCSRKPKSPYNGRKVTSDPRDGTAGRIHTEHRGGVGDIPAMQDSRNIPARDYKPGQEADRAGFEPAVTCATTVFKTVSFDRSDTCPYVSHRTTRTVGPVTKTRITVYNTLGPATPARTRPARPGREECERGRPGLRSPDPGARWGLRPPT